MFALALRNILFYKSRSLTTFFLTFFAALFFILYVALMDGSHNAMLQNSLKVYTGAIEVYKKGYREEGGNEYLLDDVGKIEEKLQSIPNIQAFTSRYETYGLLSFKERSSAAMIAGVDPQKEEQLSELKEALFLGEYLKESDANCLYMGAELAKRLKVSISDEVSFIGSASDNSFAADIFEVCGLFQTGDYGFDGNWGFVAKNYFDTLMYSQNKASYVSIRLRNLEDVETTQEQILSALHNTKLEVLSWKELMHTMVEAMEVDSIFGYISITLFFVVIFFVIMIFTFLNLSARVREFGTLASIGLSRRNISKLLFYEMFILSSTALLLATPIAAATAYYFSLYPIVIEGMSETYKQYGIISDELPLSFDIFTIAWNVAVIYGLNFLSLLYPLRYINSFTPLEALRHV